ncbi:MAG: hypothetical protein U9N81_00050 [Bacillota bacterium]|nr:hypothetical protein [Bacillota bacterium]
MQASNGDDLFGIVAEKIFDPGELAKFLESSPESLNVMVKINKGQKSIHEFSIINIPINDEVIKLSRIYEQHKELAFEHTNISINQLRISPTRMHFDITFRMEDEYPKRMEYMGEEIIIEKVNFLQKGDKTKLIIETKLPPRDILHMQGLNIAEYDGPTESGSWEHEDETANTRVQSMHSAFFIEKREQYKV